MAGRAAGPLVSYSIKRRGRFGKMDCAPNVNIFRELQTVHDTGYFSGHVSPEEDWQQVRIEEAREQ